MMSILLLVTMMPALASAADPAPVLACPQCGHWELDGASHGMTGEWLSIQPDRVDFPALGWFCARTLEQASEEGGAGRRRYRVVLGLTPRTQDCAKPMDGPGLRMQLDVDAGAGVEGSHASITIRSEAEAVLESAAWNVDRDEPCDAGSNAPFIACYSMDHARLYKQLSHVAYSVRRSLAKPAADAFARRFNPIDFAGKVEGFCDRQGSRHGGGSGATLLSKRCQVERMSAKLHELEAWQACMRTPKHSCKSPGQGFDRSDTD